MGICEESVNRSVMHGSQVLPNLLSSPRLVSIKVLVTFNISACYYHLRLQVGE